ncbi:hypothetical protein CL614_02465 [archaeon]|nr:hypothetical protein [archaeon]|tara:strand:- start:211 stop:1149 length:939 start_codon:yes stop_codon:yes gene_type:complete
MSIAFGRINNPTLANFINLKGHSSFDDAVSNKPSAKDKFIASNIINELIATIPDYEEGPWVASYPQNHNIKNPHPYNWLWEGRKPFINQWIETQARRYASHFYEYPISQDDERDRFHVTKPRWEEWQGKLLIRRADADDEDYENDWRGGSIPYLDIMYISLVNVWDDKWNDRWINKYCCPICEHDYKLKDTSAEPTIGEFRHRIQLAECPSCFEVVPTRKKYHTDDEMLVYNLRVYEYNKSIEYSENAFRDDRGAEWIALYDGHSFREDMTHIKDMDYFKGWYDATSLITNILRPHKLNMLINWHMKLPEGF